MSRPPKKSKAAKVAESWNCPTCNRSILTNYCSNCGECPIQHRDLKLRGFIGQIATACTNLDGPMVRSFRCLIAHPGSLTLAYLRGQRKPFTLPLQLFLVANVLFFATQSLIGTNVFSTSLYMHLHDQFWSGLAQPLVAYRINTKAMSLEQYTPLFDRAVALNAKSLIILMVLPFGLFLPTIFFRRRLPFVGHIVFSLHFYTFLLLVFCLASVVVGADLLTGGIGLKSERFDHALSMVQVAVCGVYLFAAVGTVYGERPLVRAIKAALLTIAVVACFLGYRFALLVITLFTT